MIAHFRRPVALLLDRHTGGRAEREDLFQDTFRLALEKLRRGELREPEKLPGFLAHLARNLAIEHYRKVGRRKTDSVPTEALDRPADGANALDDLLAGEQASLARKVIGELGTARDRELLLRFYLREEDREDLCRELELSAPQFNRVLYRARQRFKELYLAYSGSGGASAAFLMLVWMLTEGGVR